MDWLQPFAEVELPHRSKVIDLYANYYERPDKSIKAITAADASTGEPYGTLTVNLISYGIRPGNDEVILSGDLSGKDMICIAEAIADSFVPITYGPHNVETLMLKLKRKVEAVWN